MPAGKTLKVRQANQQFKTPLMLHLYNNDSQHEKSAQILPNGAWLEINNEFDSVPFVHTAFGRSESPVLEIEYGPDVPPLSIFRKNGNEEAFLRHWVETDAPFVLLIGDRARVLAPKSNRDFLANLSAKSNVRNINELLEFFEAVINKYDELIGLSDEASTPPVHQNVHTKYFIKANAHGAGGAYYGNDHTANSSSGLGMFMSKGWGPLHEIGHGYQGGFMSTKSKDDMPLSEVWNNIYAHTFEVTYSPNTGWLFGKDRSAYEASVYQSRIGGKGYHAMGLRDRLYVHIILKEHTGNQGLIHFNKKYREQRNLGKDGMRRTTDLLADYWSEGSQFDIIPYYEQYGLIVSDDCKEMVSNRNLESGCILRDLVENDGKAEEIRAATNLKSIYSIIRTRQMQSKGVCGRIIVKIAIEDFSQIQGKSLYIKDGQRLIEEVIVTQPTIVFNDIHVGVYLIRGPYSTSKPYHANSKRATISQHRDTTVELNYFLAASPFLQQFQIMLQGLADDVFATVTILAVEGKLRVDFTGRQPHSYFPNKHYVSVKIFDGPNLMYDKDFEGTTQGAFTETINLSIDGCKILINHVEPHRLKCYNSLLQQFDAEMDTKTKDNAFIITKYGLMMEHWTMDRQMECYFNRINLYQDFVKQKIGDNVDEQYFALERNYLHAAIAVLPEPIMAKYLEKYQNLILRKVPAVQNHLPLSEELVFLTPVCPALHQIQIMFQGLSNRNFATTDISVAEGKMKLDFDGKQPHSYFPNKHYASIKILDGLNSIYEKDFQGNTTGAFSDTINVSVGNKIHINHVEPGRLKFYSPHQKTYVTELETKEKDNMYVITKYGLVFDSWTKAQQLTSYVQKLNTYLGIVKEKFGDDTDETSDILERFHVASAISVLPEPVKTKYLSKYQSVILSNASAAHNASPKAEELDHLITASPALHQIQIVFQGLSNRNFATAHISIKEGKMKLNFDGKKPHSYFPDKHYASIKILDGPNSIYEKDFQGTSTGAFSETNSVSVGHNIHINHVEPARLKFFNSYLQKYDAELTTKQQDNTYVITDYGLMVASWTTAELLDCYNKRLDSYLGIIKEKIGDDTDELNSIMDRLHVTAAISALPDPVRTKYFTDYQSIILQNVPALYQIQIVFQGLGDHNFATADISVGEGKIKLDFDGEEPHCYFPNKHYASIKILDGAKSVYQKEFQGTTTGTFSDTISINVGYKIHINHIEPARLKFYNPSLKIYAAELATSKEDNTYVITKYGLMVSCPKNVNQTWQ